MWWSFGLGDVVLNHAGSSLVASSNSLPPTRQTTAPSGLSAPRLWRPRPQNSKSQVISWAGHPRIAVPSGLLLREERTGHQLRLSAWPIHNSAPDLSNGLVTMRPTIMIFKAASATRFFRRVLVEDAERRVAVLLRGLTTRLARSCKLLRRTDCWRWHVFHRFNPAGRLQ